MSLWPPRSTSRNERKCNARTMTKSVSGGAGPHGSGLHRGVGRGDQGSPGADYFLCRSPRQLGRPSAPSCERSTPAHLERSSVTRAPTPTAMPRNATRRRPRDFSPSVHPGHRLGRRLSRDGGGGTTPPLRPVGVACAGSEKWRETRNFVTRVRACPNEGHLP